MKKTELNKLQRLLPKGWVTKVMQKTGFTANYIRKILNGFDVNNATLIKVVNACIEVIKENDAEMEALSEQIAKLQDYE